MKNIKFGIELDELFANILHEDADDESNLDERLIVYLASLDKEHRFRLGDAMLTLSTLSGKERALMLDEMGFPWVLDDPNGFFSTLGSIISDMADLNF